MCAKQWKDKMRQGEKEKEKRMGGVDTGGIVRPRESSPQKQKQL